jgi:tight adherence protein B
MVLAIPIFFGGYVFYFSLIQKRQLEKIKTEFREILMSVANGLSAGTSVERSFMEAEENLKLLYKNDSVLLERLHGMNQQVRMGTAVEKQFYTLAVNSRVEEMETFGELFLYAKRMGGDYVKNIRKLSLRMDERIAMKEELESQLAEKMLELRIMAVVPLAILLYLRLSAASFLMPLYQNVGGALVMTGCFLLYVGSVLLGVVIIRKTLEV